MQSTKVAEPFLKWAGGKRRLLKTLDPLLPKDFNGYYEPFIGSGAMFFHLREKIGSMPVVLGDVNMDLMASYEAIRDHREELILGLCELAEFHDKDQYIRMRGITPITEMGRAQRFIYLNRACFNGLWRENAKGQMNTPMGDTPADKLFDYENLRAVSHALQGVTLKVGPFYDGGISLPSVDPEGWFIYLDPPYHETFSSYNKDGFSESDHRNLAKCAQYWASRGANVMISNSDTPLIRELYDGFDITVVKARRSISADRSARKSVGELVIRNYTTP